MRTGCMATHALMHGKVGEQPPTLPCCCISSLPLFTAPRACCVESRRPGVTCCPEGAFDYSSRAGCSAAAGLVVRSFASSPPPALARAVQPRISYAPCTLTPTHHLLDPCGRQASQPDGWAAQTVAHGGCASGNVTGTHVDRARCVVVALRLGDNGLSGRVQLSALLWSAQESNRRAERRVWSVPMAMSARRVVSVCRGYIWSS
jgi:hypothetical protein